MNPKLVGTWFLVKNSSAGNDHVCICRADQIHSTPAGGWRYSESETGWLDLNTKNDRFIKDGFRDVTPADFNELDLPEVTYETSPLEIEITKSGKVYYY